MLSLTIRDMEIKTTINYYLTSVRMATSKRTTNNKGLQRCEEKGTVHFGRERKLVQVLWKTLWRFPHKIKTELLHKPAIQILGIYINEMKILIQKDICIPMFTAALFTKAKIWKQPKCPSTDEWIKKTWYIHQVILLSHKLEWNLAIWDKIDEPRGCFGKWNKSSRIREILYDFTFRWNLKTKQENRKQKETDRNRINM